MSDKLKKALLVGTGIKIGVALLGGAVLLSGLLDAKEKKDERLYPQGRTKHAEGEDNVSGFVRESQVELDEMAPVYDLRIADDPVETALKAIFVETGPFILISKKEQLDQMKGLEHFVHEKKGVLIVV